MLICLPVRASFCASFHTLLTGLALAGAIAPVLRPNIAQAEPHRRPIAAPALLAHAADNTITVSVMDSSSIVAEQIQIKYALHDSSYYNYPPESAPVISSNAVKATVLAELNQAGIAASNVDLYDSHPSSYSVQIMSVVVTLPPSHTAIADATAAMQSAAASFEAITIETLGVRLGTRRCDELAREARRKTLQLARERATILADELGLSLGAVISVHDSYQDLTPYAAGTSCLTTTGEFSAVSLSNYGGEWTPYLPDAQLDITLSTMLEVTFAID